jgi:hypothetical protein
MKECPQRDALHSSGIAALLVVFLLVVGWPAVMMACAASSNAQRSAPNRIDQLMVERSVLCAAANVSLPDYGFTP